MVLLEAQLAPQKRSAGDRKVLEASHLEDCFRGSRISLALTRAER